MSSSIMPPRRPRVSMVPPPKKRRKTEHKIEEVIFNSEERQDYLSGFHKRKLQRQKQAKSEALKKEREAKLDARKSLREGRKADLERHVEAVNAVLKENDGVESDDSLRGENEAWEGTQEGPEAVDREEEYVDEDKFTTVTVEAVDVDRDGMKRVAGNIEEDDELQEGKISGKRSEETLEEQGPKQSANGKRSWVKQGSKGSTPRPKKKKFKYESKADRKLTRFREHGKNKRQAKERKTR